MGLTRRFINVMFVLLLVGTLCVSAPKAGAGDFPASADQITPLEAGDNAPAFTVQTVENEAFDFDPSSLRRPVVLISFRGGWCPYCNMHLSELRTVIPEIRAMGLDVLFISNDRPELLYASLKDQTRDDIEGLDYTILSDADLNAASALGTAFRRPDALVNNLEEKGKDYAGSSIDNHSALAVPAVYIIDKDGLIVFDYVNANYKVRLPADEVLAAARSHSSK